MLRKLAQVDGNATWILTSAMLVIFLCVERTRTSSLLYVPREIVTESPHEDVLLEARRTS